MLNAAMTQERNLPECLTRDRLTSPYFPSMTQGQLWVVTVLCAVFVLTSFNRLNHTDLWGHLCYGRWIAKHYTLPTEDPFGAINTSQPFVNTAWGSQLLGYYTHELAGEDGLILAHALLVTLSCAATMLAVRARGVSAGWSALAGALAMLLALPILGTMRPQLFGLVGFPVVLYACALIVNRRQPLLWLPPVMCLWANLHGSFLMGLVILCLLACSLSVTRSQLYAVGGSHAVARTWLLFVLSLLATWVNPLGPKLLMIVAGFGGNKVLSNISEWAALSTDKKLTLTLFTISAIVGIVVLIRSRVRRDIFDLLLLILFAGATISAIRMMAWWSFAWPWVIVPHLAGMWHRVKLHAPRTEDTPLAMRTVIAMGLVFMTFLIAPCTHAFITGQERGIANTTVSGTPLYAGEEARRAKWNGKMFAPMDWSDYFIWTSYGRLKPLVYTHVHLITPELWDDYQAIASAQPEWLMLAQKYDLRYIVADRDPKRKSLLARTLAEASFAAKPTTRIVYQDQKCIVVELLPQ
jgi:hypothetical protein